MITIAHTHTHRSVQWLGDGMRHTQVTAHCYPQPQPALQARLQQLKIGMA